MKEYIVYESKCKWWWFFLHPIDAMVMSHYGCICCDYDYYKQLTRYGYKK